MEEKKAYLYSLWGGRFVVYEGEVWKSHLAGHSVFDSKTKRMQCSTEPAVVYNATVWFPERDDEKARKILVDYELSVVAGLQEKIGNHLQKIEVLQTSQKIKCL